MCPCSYISGICSPGEGQPSCCWASVKTNESAVNVCRDLLAFDLLAFRNVRVPQSPKDDFTCCALTTHPVFSRALHAYVLDLQVAREYSDFRILREGWTSKQAGFVAGMNLICDSVGKVDFYAV